MLSLQRSSAPAGLGAGGPCTHPCATSLAKWSTYETRAAYHRPPQRPAHPPVTPCPSRRAPHPQHHTTCTSTGYFQTHLITHMSSSAAAAISASPASNSNSGPAGQLRRRPGQKGRGGPATPAALAAGGHHARSPGSRDSELQPLVARYRDSKGGDSGGTSGQDAAADQHGPQDHAPSGQEEGHQQQGTPTQATVSTSTQDGGEASAAAIMQTETITVSCLDRCLPHLQRHGVTCS
jgi:hypothetical protein